MQKTTIHIALPAFILPFLEAKQLITRLTAGAVKG